MKIPVLYIAGAGRSGSTLLELILGNRPGFFSVGEIRHFWSYWQMANWRCGCDELLRACPFWLSVVKKLQTVDTELETTSRLAADYNRTRNLVFMSRRKGCYFPAALVAATQNLYQSIWAESGTKIIVDSSKAPSHLYLLTQTGAVDLRIIHLVRDSRAVAYSWSKRPKQELGIAGPATTMPTKSSLIAALIWAIENFFAIYAGQQVAHYTLLRYEDFVQRPDTALNTALQKVGLPEQDLSHLKQKSFLVEATHSVGGNPLRFEQDAITIHNDNAWQYSLNRWQQISLGLLVSPLMSRLGYHI